MKNIRHMKLFLSIAFLLAPGGRFAFAQTPELDKTWHGIDLSGMDRSVKPCEDLFRFANGAWFDKSTIPADRTLWGVSEFEEEQNNLLLHSILDAAAADTHAPKQSPIRKVGDFYASGMDLKRIEKEGAKPVAPEMALIEGIHDVAGLREVIAVLHREAIFPVFSSSVQSNPKDSTQMIFSIGEGGLGLPDRDYYLDTDEKMQTIRREYVAHVAKMFALLGDTSEAAQMEARTVMALETRLAHVALDKVVRRDPYATVHVLTEKEVDALTPDLSWQPYLRTVGLRKPCPINVDNPVSFREVGKMMMSVPLDDWKIYLRWQVIHATASALSTPFVNEDFHFYQTILGGTTEIEPRWKRVLHAIDSNIGEALGQLYVAKAFPPEAKARVRSMVANIQAALRERLQSLEWMNEATRKQALHKLDTMVVKVGYPDTWRDYSRLNIDRRSYYGNLRRSSQFEYARELAKIGKPRDRKEWLMTPPTVNAYYDPTLNEIVFPAGILQPPYFDAQTDDAVNYGSIGAVFGHEITHAFDDEGRKYDAEGNLKEWWTEDDAKNYQSRASLIEKQYSDYTVLDNLHVNGGLTLGENIADIGGLKIAWLAFQKTREGKSDGPLIDGFTPDQRYFLAFAQSWREKRRPEAERLLVTTNEHAPENLRVVGPVSLMPEFYEAFHCPVPEAIAARAKQAIW